MIVVSYDQPLPKLCFRNDWKNRDFGTFFDEFLEIFVLKRYQNKLGLQDFDRSYLF